MKLIEQANIRHQKIRDINSSDEVRDADLVHAKIKKKMDNVNDSDGSGNVM